MLTVETEPGREPGMADNRTERIRAMYSGIRYPGLNPAENARYVRHRRYVYATLGIDCEAFFRGKTVLDAGCGTGEETIFLASLGPERVIGIDTSEGSLEVARAGAARVGARNLEFRLASVLDETIFADVSFDYVSSLGCIHHTADMPRAFANLSRMVKPGGHLCTFIYNSYGHFVYDLECSLLDRIAGDEVEARVRWARRLFDWRRNKTFRREGVAASYDGRLYDKYGVLYRESLTLGTLLRWYREQGFEHAGSFPMYLRDMVEGLFARDPDGLPAGIGGRRTAAAVLRRLIPARHGPREWTWGRRASMQALLLAIGLVDYGSAFRVLGRKRGNALGHPGSC